MFRLRHVVLLMTNAVLVGSLLILVLAMGWDSWLPIVAAIAAGHLLSWPAAVLVARWIKARDPAWDERRDRPTPRTMRERADGL